MKSRVHFLAWLTSLATLAFCPPAAGVDNWSALGLADEPALVVFSRNVAPPARRYFIPERMTRAGVVLQYDEKRILESFKQALGAAEPSFYTAACPGFVHVRSAGKWTTWQLLSDAQGAIAGVQTNDAGGTRVFGLPWAFVTQLREKALLTQASGTEATVGKNVLTPAKPGYSLASITDPPRLKVPVGGGAPPAEARRKMADPEEPFDRATVRLKIYIPNGYRDDVPCGVIIYQGLFSDVSKVNDTLWPTSALDERKLILAIVAGRPPNGMISRWEWVARANQEARSFILRNYHVDAGRCYLAQRAYEVLHHAGAYPDDYPATCQIESSFFYTYVSKNVGLTRNEKILPPDSIKALRERGHRMVLLTGGPVTRPLVDPTQISDQQAMLAKQGLVLKHLPAGATPFEQQLLEALDFMDDQDAAVVQDTLAPGDEREIKRLEDMATKTPIQARALAQDLWTNRPHLRGHVRFAAVLAVLETLPTVAM